MQPGRRRHLSENGGKERCDRIAKASAALIEPSCLDVGSMSDTGRTDSTSPPGDARQCFYKNQKGSDEPLGEARSF
jgi:hypothetical protein